MDFLILTLVLAAPSFAADQQQELGLRVNAMHAGSSEASSMFGAGVLWRYHLRDAWFVDFSLDYYEYEIDDVLGKTGRDPSNVDLPVRSTVFATSLGRQHRIGDSDFDWFWHAGFGLGLSSASGLSGVDQSGMPYDLHTESGTEIHLTASLGAAWHFSQQWTLVGSGRTDHRFVDIQTKDRTSEVSHTVESLTPIGLFVSINYRF